MMNSLPFDTLIELIRAGAIVSTDTRNLSPGSIFFALKGERFDANEFAEEAKQNGAEYVITERKDLQGVTGFLVVDDTLTALQDLARKYRETLSIPVIAIAGSNGKTTTKELTGAVLNMRHATAVTKGNLNNHIGVPLTLLSIRPEHEMAVVEIGANHLEETAFLCEIARPDYGLVTNNGKDHLEGFGSVEGVKKANAELFEWLRKSEGTAFVNADDADLMHESGQIKRVTYGTLADADVRGTLRAGSVLVAVDLDKGGFVQTHLFGKYNLPNILAAVAIGRFFSVPESDIHQALETYRPGLNRSQISRAGSNTVVFDCYNANPSSMKASVESFLDMKAPNSMLILADMLEMGEYAAEEHVAMVRFLESCGIKEIWLIGPEFSRAAQGTPFRRFSDTKEAGNYLQQHPIEAATILLKGSRGFKLEQLFPHE
jgi:UDP-N-acetylmuramoyl-tripeptide--D-alanyl-D-alanine ligase